MDQSLKAAFSKSLGHDLQRCLAADTKSNVLFMADVPVKQLHLDAYRDVLVACVKLCPDRVLTTGELTRPLVLLDTDMGYKLSKGKTNKTRVAWAQREAL
jgi:hypothetical protein